MGKPSISPNGNDLTKYQFQPGNPGGPGAPPGERVSTKIRRIMKALKNAGLTQELQDKLGIVDEEFDGMDAILVRQALIALSDPDLKAAEKSAALLMDRLEGKAPQPLQHEGPAKVQISFEEQPIPEEDDDE